MSNIEPKKIAQVRLTTTFTDGTQETHSVDSRDFESGASESSHVLTMCTGGFDALQVHYLPGYFSDSIR